MKKKEAKAFYRKIGRIWCPALNDSIVFNKTGFQHLLYKGKKRRTLREQERRFLLLEYARDMLQNPNIHITPTLKRKSTYQMKNHDARMYAKPEADFWAVTDLYKERTITIIIRQIDGKEKHFFSIFDEKSKVSKNRRMTVD